MASPNRFERNWSAPSARAINESRARTEWRAERADSHGRLTIRIEGTMSFSAQKLIANHAKISKCCYKLGGVELIVSL